MSELNTKNPLISLIVLVKDLKVWLVSGDEVAKQKLLYYLSLRCWLNWSVQSEMETEKFKKWCHDQDQALQP